MKKRGFTGSILYWRKGMLLALGVSALLLPARSPGEESPSEVALSPVNSIVNGIISYTRWPQLNGLPRLCIFSSATSASQLAREQNRPVFTPVMVANTDQALRENCDAVYFGHESVQQQIALREQYHGKPQLYIAEQNPDCSAGSVFCLNITDKKISFSVNLDSLSRSGVRVSPDVLMLARARKNNDE